MRSFLMTGSSKDHGNKTEDPLIRAEGQISVILQRSHHDPAL
jgi:hypothetical protein